MNKHQSKYFNTATLFDQTLIKLLEKKELNYISIKEICSCAGVNRSTFYLHYETINDLLNETISYITNKLIENYDISPDTFIKQIHTADKEDLILINKTYLKPFIIFIKDYKNIFLSAFQNSGTLMTKDKYHNLNKYILDPILTKFKVKEDEKKYLINFYLDGIFGIIKTWVLNDCNDDVDKVVDIIINCVKI